MHVRDFASLLRHFEWTTREGECLGPILARRRRSPVRDDPPVGDASPVALPERPAAGDSR